LRTHAPSSAAAKPFFPSGERIPLSQTSWDVVGCRWPRICAFAKLIKIAEFDAGNAEEVQVRTAIYFGAYRNLGIRRLLNDMY
jgi:hypothetical protein